MAQSREDVVAAISSVFPSAESERVLTLLDTYGVHPYERERERVQLAIISLSEGDEEKLRYFLSVAKRDYRDVLFWSEYAADAKIDTPEKKRQMRELFEMLGLQPPSSLQD